MGFGDTVLFSLCLSCEFPPFLSFVSGVLEKLGRDSVEMVHRTATVTVAVQGRARGPPSLASSQTLAASWVSQEQEGRP